MWSVWSNAIRASVRSVLAPSYYLHLGQGFALMQVPRAPVQVLQFASTLPLASQLARVEQALPQPLAKGAKLHITLSAALCPASTVAMPAALTQWSDVQQIAQAHTAANLGLASERTALAIDTDCLTITAGLPNAWLEQLRHWSQSHALALRSVQPLWALATQCAAVRSSTAQGLIVQEPDATTVLHLPATGPAQANSLLTDSTETDAALEEGQTGATLAHSHDAPHALALSRSLVSIGLEANQLLNLQFHTKAGTVDRRAPARWAAHWSLGARP